MANEHICQLDILPQKLPDICLWATFCDSKISSNLDVTAVEDWPIGCNFLD